MTKNFNIGDRIAITKGPGIIHYGIFIGLNLVIDNSKTMGRVVIRSLKEFAGGKQVRLVSYKPVFPPAEVVARAKARVGKPYGWFSQNCEHFVNEVQLGTPKSAQALVGGAILAFLVSKIFSK